MPVARQSALDKAKADAKARKLRDEREAASALEEFVKEFEAEVSDEEHHRREWRTGGTEGGMQHTSTAGAGARVAVPRGGGGGARRHFTTAPKDVCPYFLFLVRGLMVGGGRWTDGEEEEFG
jgi:hypothetical protein